MLRVLLAVAALGVALGTVFAFSELATHRGGRTVHVTPKFLTRALGAPRPKASLVRTPAPHVKVTVDDNGLSVADAAGTVGLAAVAASTSGWRRYAHGAARTSSIGTEAVLFDAKGQGAEDLVVVDSHHGVQTWQWKLDTTFTPRVTPSGVVGFFDGRQLATQWIPAVKILDAHKRNVTPRGLVWSTARRNGHWWLELRLNDHRLPGPYTIDPAVLRTSGAGTVATGNGTFNVVIPPAAVAQDLLILHAQGNRWSRASPDYALLPA